MFALVDCNNFYASCERVFNPALEKVPVVVLSNNDGNIISRSNEAKQLGIPMGAPFYQWQKYFIENNVRFFSSNYELYGDMSQRVMTVLKERCVEVEVYSIDEAFLKLELSPSYPEQMKMLRQTIMKWTGIPVSIGCGQTKTLAKIANHMAKRHTRHFIYDLAHQDLQNDILKKIPVKKIWGIAEPLAERLQKLNIYSARDLRDADAKMLRIHFSVTLEKIVHELRGVSCLPLESIQPRKQIIVSRSFSKQVILLQELEEAISHYAAIASLKLRKQHYVASGLGVFVHTNIFNKNIKQYANSLFFSFPIPTADTSYIISIAKKCLSRIYKKNYKYHKVGIILLDLSPETIKQYDMFTNIKRNERLMKTIDAINNTLGKNTIYYCAQGILRSWQIKSDFLSPRYTTRWNELAKVLTN